MRINNTTNVNANPQTTPRVEKNFCPHPSIISLKIGKEKITAFLTDKREISIPTNWLTDKKPFSLSQLEHYEIWDGREIY